MYNEFYSENFYENQKDSFVKSVLSSPPSNNEFYFSKNLPIRTIQRFLIYGYYNKSENVVTFFTTWIDKEMYFKTITKCLDELQSQYSSEEEND